MRWEAQCLPSGLKAYCSGIGAERAAAAAEQAVLDGADILVSFGSAAGLNPSITSGKLLVTDQVYPIAPALSFQRESWRQKLTERLKSLEPLAEPIAQSTTLLSTVARKRALFEQSHAQAADMESAAIAAVARQHQRLFVAIRVILDDAHSVMPSALVQVCSVYGEVRVIRLCGLLLRRPSLIKYLPGLAMAQRKAMNTLSTAGEILAVDASWRSV